MPILFKPGCPSEHLISVDKMNEPYPNNAAVDMEASAFFAVATRYTKAELVQSVKVVSDNSLHGVDQITAGSASLWMGDAVDLFQQTISQLRELAAHLPSSKFHETA